MKIINGVRYHTIEISDQLLSIIQQLAMVAMAPYQQLLAEIGRQLPQQSPPAPAPPQPGQSAPMNGAAPTQDLPPPQPPQPPPEEKPA